MKSVLKKKKEREREREKNKVKQQQNIIKYKISIKEKYRKVQRRQSEVENNFSAK